MTPSIIYRISLLLMVSLIACRKTPENNPTPWAMHIIDNTSFGSDGTKVSDVNGDGLEDIVCGWEQGGIARLYVHPLKGEHWDYVEVPAPAVEDALLVDLDGDGKQDIVTFSEGEHKRISIHWAPHENHHYLDSEKWESEDIPATVGLTQWMFGRPMDVDHKNGVDLIVGSKNDGAILAWLASPEDPRDIAGWKIYPIATVGWVMSIEVLDIDRDGKEDVLISDRYGEQNGIRWFKNPGADSDDVFGNWEERLIGMRGQEPMFLDITDEDENGLWEIWIPDRTKNFLNFSQEDASGEIWNQQSIPFSENAGPKGKSVAMGDIDGDGRLDMVTSYAEAKDKSGIMWASFNPETNNWKYFDVSGPAGVKFDFVYLLDMDKDGDLDILSSEENNNSRTEAGLGVIWYENQVYGLTLK